MDSKSKVTLVITSAGQNWVPLGLEKSSPGKMLKQTISRIEYDVTDFPDPVNQPEMKNLLGIDPAAREYVLSTSFADNWIIETAVFVRQSLEGMDVAGQGILHVAIRCRGGFQRSVVLAEELAQIMRRQRPDLTILVAHLTLPLVLALRQKHFGVNLDAVLTPEDVMKLI